MLQWSGNTFTCSDVTVSIDQIEQSGCDVDQIMRWDGTTWVCTDAQIWPELEVVPDSAYTQTLVTAASGTDAWNDRNYAFTSVRVSSSSRCSEGIQPSTTSHSPPAPTTSCPPANRSTSDLLHADETTWRVMGKGGRRRDRARRVGGRWRCGCLPPGRQPYRTHNQAACPCGAPFTPALVSCWSEKPELTL